MSHDIDPYPDTPPLPDAADWPFIACAWAMGHPTITGNLNRSPKSSGVSAMSPPAWVQGGKEGPMA